MCALGREVMAICEYGVQLRGQAKIVHSSSPLLGWFRRLLWSLVSGVATCYSLSLPDLFVVVFLSPCTVNFLENLLSVKFLEEIMVKKS